ncbi:MAG: hypothetical protein WC755_07580 [Candidatus Woesearchaeota archaeon]|jgi:uncharacterized protein YxeA
MKTNLTKMLVILVIILIASNIFLGYLIFKKPNKGSFSSFQPTEISDEEKNAVTSFFQSTTDSAEIKTYCEKNKEACFYYCRQIDSTNSACADLMPARGQMPSGSPIQNSENN